MMLSENASQVVTNKDYPDPSPFTGGSRREEMDISEILDRQFFVLTRRNLPKKLFLYQSLPTPLEIDSSSVYPYFKVATETHVSQELTEEDIIGEMLEHDFIVRMSPVKEYTVQARIKSVEKAVPRIVEPEVF